MVEKNSTKTKKIVAVAMFSALAFVTAMLCGYFPKVAGFLSLDFKDAIIVICALIFGPFAALPIAVLVPLLEMLTISITGWYGLVMNILSSATFVLTTGVIYKYKRSFYGAIAALAAGVFSVAAVMMIANLLITPLYLTYVVGVPSTMSDVAAMLPGILLPFNFIKALLNGAIVLLLYKPVSSALKSSGFVQNKTTESNSVKKSKARSVIVSLIALVIIAVSLCVMFLVLK
jgi:riboflavin transporter FmnP